MSNPLTLISIFFVVIPMTLSLASIQSSRIAAAMFVLFALGLATELVMHQSSDDQVHHIVFDLYCLCECTLFAWILHSGKEDSSTSLLLRIFFLLSLPLWVICLFVYPFLFSTTLSGTALFNMVYEAAIGFYAGTKLLALVEREGRLVHMPLFWIFLGIFFYCFSTFFIMSLLNTGLADGVWYLNNIMNIITYILYAVGLWKMLTLRNITR